jgi:3-deoxy-manno-octulosonate cytidylyltransferase (CMP-KDO synthetase)
LLVADPDFYVVIPARYDSSRFPGKPLALLAGRPMIRHVFERSRASGAKAVIVATDDERIAAAVRAFDAPVVMTRADHSTGTERVAEVAAQGGWSNEAIVVNVQGDSPLMPSASIAQVAGLLAGQPRAAIATLCTPVTSPVDYRNPNVVKVVMDQAGRALYFSRAPIPCAAHGSDRMPEAWRHLGIYGYRKRDLLRLSDSPPCHIEMVEKLEQLRALWLGMEIVVGIAAQPHGPDVDVPEDLVVVERFLRGEVEGSP